MMISCPLINMRPPNLKINRAAQKNTDQQSPQAILSLRKRMQKYQAALRSEFMTAAKFAYDAMAAREPADADRQS